MISKIKHIFFNKSLDLSFMILPPNIKKLMFIVNLIIYYINNKSIYVSHLLETLAQSAGAEVVKKAALLAEGNEWIDSSGCSL